MYSPMVHKKFNFKKKFKSPKVIGHNVSRCSIQNQLWSTSSDSPREKRVTHLVLYSYRHQEPWWDIDSFVLIGHSTTKKIANHFLIESFYSWNFCLATAFLEKEFETWPFSLLWSSGKVGKSPLVSSSWLRDTKTLILWSFDTYVKARKLVNVALCILFSYNWKSSLGTKLQGTRILLPDFLFLSIDWVIFSTHYRSSKTKPFIHSFIYSTYTKKLVPFDRQSTEEIWNWKTKNNSYF